VRAVYAVFAELTSNEMANLHRYTYLYDPATGAYDNPFDSGIVRNTIRFFVGLRGVPPPDWDAMFEAARTGKLPRPPLLSMAALFRFSARLKASCGWLRPARQRSADAPAHGHSHGGRECAHDHGGHGLAPEHGHSHGGRECSHDHGAHSRQMVQLSQLPPAVQQQVLAQLAARGLTPEALGIV
jgi:hypothetical protein